MQKIYSDLSAWLGGEPYRILRAWSIQILRQRSTFNHTLSHSFEFGALSDAISELLEQWLQRNIGSDTSLQPCSLPLEKL